MYFELHLKRGLSEWEGAVCFCDGSSQAASLAALLLNPCSWLDFLKPPYPCNYCWQQIIHLYYMSKIRIQLETTHVV